MTGIKVSETRRLLIFINIVISCIACSMLSTALTTALPPIISDLNISVTTGQWLTSGYSLAMAITMPLTAFLVGRFPTKRLYCSAILIFIIGLLLSACSFGFPMMMIGRVIQAVGNGMLTAMAQVIVLTIFPPEKRGTAMGWYGLSVGAAPVIAPTIAGALVDTIGWRMIFIASFVIMLISMIYAVLVFADVLDTSEKKFDTVSFVMSALAFGGLTLGIGNIGSFGFLSIEVLGALVIGVIAAIMFTKRQLGLDTPFLDLKIFKNKNYTVSVLGSMLLYFIMMGSSIVLPLYVQQTMGLSATISALVMLPGSLVTAVISPFAGKLYDKIGMRLLFIVGSLFLFISNLLMIFIGQSSSIWLASAFNVIRSAAIGCMMMPLVTWGAGNVEQQKTSHATALLTSLRTVAGAIGSAVFVAVLNTVSNNSVDTYGSGASMHGVNITFLVMTLFCILLFVLAMAGTKELPKALRKQSGDISDSTR